MALLLNLEEECHKTRCRSRSAAQCGPHPHVRSVGQVAVTMQNSLYTLHRCIHIASVLICIKDGSVVSTGSAKRAQGAESRQWTKTCSAQCSSKSRVSTALACRRMQLSATATLARRALQQSVATCLQPLASACLMRTTYMCKVAWQHALRMVAA